MFASEKAENQISPFEIVDESYIFENCSLDCMYIGYFLKDYEITHRYLQWLFCERLGIIFAKSDYALMVDCLLRKNDKMLLKKILSYNSDEEDIIRLLNKLIEDKAYREFQLTHFQLNPETAGFREIFIFENK